MTLLSLLGIATAYAEAPVAATTTAVQQHPGNFWSMLWLPLLLIVVFYFLLIRPQSKRAKQHRELIDALSVGDEVVTTGGVVGRIARLRDNFVVIEIAKGVEMTMQKGAIASVLPKGTVDSL